MKRLTGGKIIGTNPDRLQIPLHADKPKARVGAPGTVFGTTGVYIQASECSKRQYGIPEPTLAKILVRQIGSEVYLLIGCAQTPGPDVYEFKFDRGNKMPTIRGLKPLFDEAGINLRPDLWYEEETEIVHDESLGYAVAVNWTKVTTRPRQEGEDEAAAAQQSGPGQ